MLRLETILLVINDAPLIVEVGIMYRPFSDQLSTQEYEEKIH